MTIPRQSLRKGRFECFYPLVSGDESGVSRHPIRRRSLFQSVRQRSVVLRVAGRGRSRRQARTATVTVEPARILGAQLHEVIRRYDRSDSDTADDDHLAGIHNHPNSPHKISPEN